jgi:hypothetical protein
MDDGHLTRHYLESLATRELTALGDNLGLDIPPDLDRSFVIEELLEAQKDKDDSEARDAGEYIPPEQVPQEQISPASISGGQSSGKVDYLESVPVPRQYNVTYIKTLIRDPLWVFVFWEIKGQDKELYENAQGFEGYYLQASPAAGGAVPSSLSFTVPVGPDDTAWYLGFPPDHSEKGVAGGGWYQVELCVKEEAKQVVLAVSRPFKLPALLPPADRNAARSPLAGLSAIDELPVIRSGDRRSRLPRGLRQ